MIRIGNKRIKLRVSKRTRLISHILASAAFIGLFIWGWGLEVKTAITYFVICAAFLVAILCVAAVLAFLMRIIQKSFDSTDEE